MARESLTALVTGAAGFLGSYTTKSLIDRGYRVRALDLPETNLITHLNIKSTDAHIQIDSRNLLDVSPNDELFAGVDVIFHCAGIADHRPSIEYPEQFFQTNILPLVRVLNAARLNRVKKVIHPSSAAVYGRPDWPTSETHPIAPINPYGLSKYIAEQVAQKWWHLYGVETISFRIFNGYGPDSDERHGLVGAFLQQKLSGRPVTISGTGSQRRDFIFVSDIVDAFICAAESDVAGEIFNLGTGAPETILSLAEFMEVEIEFISSRGDELATTCADISRIRDRLGWSPDIRLKEGIEHILRNISGPAT